MGLKLNTASGGSVSIEPTNTASDYTLTVPAQTGTVVATDSSGNVGLGVTPSAWSTLTALQIKNAGFAGYANRSYMCANTYFNGSSWVYLATDSANFYAQQNGQHEWYRAPSGTAGTTATFTQAMTLDTSGNLLVGSTSTGVENGNYFKMEVSNRYMRFGHSGTGNGTDFVKFDYNGTQTGGINQNSTTSVAYVTTSDYRLKENIAPMTGALEKVAQLKPCTYTWKSNGEQAEGFIAHELAEVCPSAVTGEKDWVDVEGNPVYQGIDTSFLVATLTAAIQELKAEVDAQAAEIALLKGQA